MAAFRLVYFPPTAANFSRTRHRFLPAAPQPSFVSLITKPQRSSLQLLLAQASSAQVQVEAQPAIQSESSEENVSVGEEVSNTRLLISNVPWTCTADDLRSLLENYGTVVDIEFSMYNKTKNRGLAFVTMGSHEEALAALTNLELTEYGGRVLKLNWAMPKKVKPSTPPRPKPQPVHNLFVANLAFMARAKDLKEFFNAENANVVSAEVIFQDNPRQSLGYGFVSFNTEAEAKAALVAFQGKEFMGRQIRVAKSKKFLRKETKAAIESEIAEET